MTNNEACRISIVIVTSNSGKVLPQCLEKLAQQTYKFFEIIMIDNNSSDGSLENLPEKYPAFRLQISIMEKNEGFAVANNLGARLARGKWLALLNADAFPEPEWSERPLQTAQWHPNMRLLDLVRFKPMLLSSSMVLEMLITSTLAWRISFGYSAKRYGLNETELVNPCAAAMYLRVAFWDAGSFDEDFFSYYEDIDLGFRLRLRGHRSLYVPEAVVHHIGSATFGQRTI
jgi:GT2 family glycosyltransferase